MATTRRLAILLGGVFLVGSMGKSALAQSTDTRKVPPEAAKPRIERARVRPAISSDRATVLDFNRTDRALAQAANGRYRDDNQLALDRNDQETRSESEETGAVGHPGEDAVAERQSVDAFNSIEDGQPGAPGELELEFNIGYFTSSREEDAATLETELEYTLDGSEFLRNTQLILSLPLELGNGGIDGNADITFGWQQRWIKEDGMVPTIATLAEIRTPSGDDSSGVDGTFTGIVAKDLGPGTLYFNAFLKTVNGNNIEDRRDFQWGFLTGYKWRLNDQLALIGDYTLKSSESDGNADVNLLELSAEYHVNEHLTIGPGIFIGLDDNGETPNFGAGVRVLYGF